MLVLNTTSPRASPSAPAATPRYQVPSSSARMAIIFLCVAGPHPRHLCLRARRRSALVAATLYSALFLLLKRRGDSVPFARQNAHRRRPSLVAVVLESHRV